MNAIKRNSFFFLFLLSGWLTAQDFSGDWYGLLKVSGMQLSVVFHVNDTEEGYTATMDSPDQQAFGIPVTQTLIEKDSIQLKIASAGIVYKGVKDSAGIAGVFFQAGQFFPLALSSKPSEKEEVLREQEPVGSLPYNTTEVAFENEAEKITLKGTLTTPKDVDTYPVAVLISGSGGQDRNSELFGHKPFLVLADYLTRQGIAVLRFDDRGIAESEGEYSSATTADLATDVAAAVQFLEKDKEHYFSAIGLIGHSEGGLIAPKVATENKKIDFVVLLAAPGIRGKELLLLQKGKIEAASGIDEATIAQSRSVFSGAYDIVLSSKAKEDELTEEIDAYFITKFGPLMPETQRKALSKSLSRPWMKSFIRFTPKDYLRKLKCAVLAVNGSLDLQVPAKENLEAIRSNLASGKAKEYEIVEVAGLNHLFQEAETGHPSEYGQIEQTFSPKALQIIGDWIVNHTR